MLRGNTLPNSLRILNRSNNINYDTAGRQTKEGTMIKIGLILFSIYLFATAVQANEILATVGQSKITLKDFNEKYELVKSQSVVAPPPKPLFLEDLIRYEIGLQEAKKKQIIKNPKVQDRINQELYKSLIELEIGKQVEALRDKITEQEMKNWYRKNPAVRTSHILIQFKPDANPKEKAAAKARAQEIYNEVKVSKRPFADLVKLYSDDTLSKKNGGDIGYQTIITLHPNYYNAARRLKPNQISPLVETTFGFHIIQFIKNQPYNEANKSQIHSAVFNEKRKEIFDRYFAQLKKNYPIKIHKKNF